MNELQGGVIRSAASRGSPILVVYFNRPQHLEKLLLSLKTFSPRVIYFSCDGPREGNPSDLEDIKKCDQLIKLHVDWSCDIKFLTADSNHGCDNWVPKSITWLFENETQGLILEDDCIIDSHFYNFASSLLDRYESVEDIMSISALSFVENDSHATAHESYHYSCYPLTWGWATWKRSWANYKNTIDTSRFDSIMKDWLITNGFNNEEIRFWKKFFLRLQNCEVTYWDAKWIYSIWMKNALSITPNVNLVKNIGFGADATHTKASHDVPQLEILGLPLPILHPGKIKVSSSLDRKTFLKRFKFTFKKKVLLILKLIMGGG